MSQRKNKIPKRGSLDYELRRGVFEFYDVGLFPRSTDFSLLQNVQTGSTAHPATCSMDTGNFQGAMRKAIEVNHSPPSSAEVKNERSYTSTPPYTFMAWTGKNLPLPVRRICYFQRGGGSFLLRTLLTREPSFFTLTHQKETREINCKHGHTTRGKQRR
jgi:hypothetical protein